MITSLIELRNFGHMTTSTIYFENIFVGDVMDSSHDAKNFISKYLYFKKLASRFLVANFTDVIKIGTVCIKRTLKDPKNVKRIKNCVLKCNLYLYNLMQQKLMTSGKKMLMSSELKECVTGFLYFLGLF